VELGVRAFYADRNAKVPMLVSGAGLLIYIGMAVVLMGPLAATGIALANTISYSIQAVVLVILLNWRLPERFKLGGTAIRSLTGAGLGGLCAWLVNSFLPIPIPLFLLAIGAMGAGALVSMIPIWREIKLLVHL